jgi:hypothetical protein
VREADHLVTDRHIGDTVAHLVDDPREVAALARGEGGRPSLVQQPGPDRGLTGIDPGRPDPDHGLVVAGDGSGDVDNLEHVDVAVTLEPDGLGHRYRIAAERATSAFIRGPGPPRSPAPAGPHVTL